MLRLLFILQLSWRATVQFPVERCHGQPRMESFRLGCAHAHPHRSPAITAQSLGILPSNPALLDVMGSIPRYPGC
ncbi:hypothetical protein EDB83DRAFT_2444416 [Lactarius deliciosus]|nr:hypothetical protein EDB83DRAFT_2444416 [Lactarius deliciosus]